MFLFVNSFYLAPINPLKKINLNSVPRQWRRQPFHFNNVEWRVCGIFLGERTHMEVPYWSPSNSGVEKSKITIIFDLSDWFLQPSVLPKTMFSPDRDFLHHKIWTIIRQNFIRLSIKSQMVVNIYCINLWGVGIRSSLFWDNPYLQKSLTRSLDIVLKMNSLKI